MTYGGGPEGGIVRLASSMTSTKLWYVWHRDWGRPATVLRIPRELTPVSRHDDGYEAIKLVMDDYELGEDEHYLDDLEDTVEDEQDSDYGLRNDDGDEADERRENDEARWGGRQHEDDDEDDDGGRERDPETDAEDEMEDEAEDYEALVNNEMREEVAALVEQIRDYSERMGNESTPSGIMTLNMLINQANERCRELRTQLAARRGGEANERREEIEQLNQERRQEIEQLTRELADNRELAEQRRTVDGVMAANYVIHASELRIAELKNEIALSGR